MLREHAVDQQVVGPEVPGGVEQPGHDVPVHGGAVGQGGAGGEAHEGVEVGSPLGPEGGTRFTLRFRR